ncbi:hypothetical protein BDB01DRAFT_133741 [Pilobolus umbonatus]|nr:hypothetical protein BDB01DRAFT_133741 [Pilobolus umbonatus]
MHINWKDNNQWEFMDMASTVLKDWIECDMLDNAHTLFEDLQEILQPPSTPLNSHQIRILLRCYTYTAAYSSICSHPIEAQHYYTKASEYTVDIDTESNYLLQISISIALFLAKKRESRHLIQWISNTLSNHPSLYTVQSCSLQDTLLDLIIDMYYTQNGAPESTHVQKLLALMDNLHENIRKQPKYYVAKVLILLKSNYIQRDSCAWIQAVFYEVVENIVLSRIEDLTK